MEQTERFLCIKYAIIYIIRNASHTHAYICLIGRDRETRMHIVIITYDYYRRL